MDILFNFSVVFSATLQTRCVASKELHSPDTGVASTSTSMG